MRWSLKIAKLAQIDVYIHFTFFILLTWVAFIQWKQSESIGAAFLGVVFILAIFACVVLHELGHALTSGKCRDCCFACSLRLDHHYPYTG
jgi:Zn-dependent protease